MSIIKDLEVLELRDKLQSLIEFCIWAQKQKPQKITMKQANKAAHKEQQDLEDCQRLVRWFCEML